MVFPEEVSHGESLKGRQGGGFIFPKAQCGCWLHNMEKSIRREERKWPCQSKWRIQDTGRQQAATEAGKAAGGPALPGGSRLHDQPVGSGVQAGGRCAAVQEDGLRNEMRLAPSLVRLASAPETLNCFICETGERITPPS